MTARVALTYRDYSALPDDGKRYEIHDGELSVAPAPTSDHQIVSANLFMIFLNVALYKPNARRNR